MMKKTGIAMINFFSQKTCGFSPGVPMVTCSFDSGGLRAKEGSGDGALVSGCSPKLPVADTILVMRQTPKCHS